MADSSIAVTPGSGVNLDSSLVTSGAGAVQREGVTIGDPTNGLAKASVSNTAPSNADYALSVRPIGENVWGTGFSAVGSSLVDSNFTQLSLGTGLGVTQAASSLLITTGTTANQDFLAVSSQSFNGNLILRYTTILSQRILQNNFMVALADKIGDVLATTINSATSISVTLTAHGLTSANVGQFMFIGAITGAAGVPGRYAIASIPDANTINITVAGWPASGSCTVSLFGRTHLKVLYNGTTATAAAFDGQRSGWATGDTTMTVNTTASPGHLVQILSDGRNVFVDDTLRASSTTPAVTTRASRVENIPDDASNLYVYIWAYNGTSNPATTTTWTIGGIFVENCVNLPVSIMSQKFQGQQSAAPISVISGTLPTVTTVGTLTNITNWGNLVDNAAFTDGTTRLSPNGYVFDEVAGTTLTENDIGAARIDVKRAQVLTIEDATTRGQRLAVSALGAIDVRSMGSYTPSNQTTNTTVTIKSGAGVLHAVTVNTAGTGSTCTIYDNTAASGTKIGTVNTAVLGTSLTFNAAFATGLTIVTAGAGAADITVMYL